MLKAEKVEFVNRLKEEIKGYKSIGIMPLGMLPDRLLQHVRNSMKGSLKIVVARKNLLIKALDSETLSRLVPYVNGNVALVLSNEDPFELYSKISSNRLKMQAKPGQAASSDIAIEAGETTIAPGQAVTDLKAAGIDVQIQKGKVVIAKGKVLVPKGTKISVAVSKALKMLDIMPFEAGATLDAVISGNLLFTKDVLGITPEVVRDQIATSFARAYALSLEAGYITPYNIDVFIKKAYFGALGVGIAANIYEPGIVEQLIAKAIASAVSLKNAGNISV